MHFRSLSISDLDALVGLDSLCFVSPWPKQQLADELVHPEALVIGAFEGDELVGAVCSRLVYDETWIFRIMTLPALRRKRIAHRLLKAVDKRYDLWLEVSAQNQVAVAFYEREGFSVQNIRKGYYPKEGDQKVDSDALVMKRSSEKNTLDYELLDFGEGFRLERFGNNIVMRPDATATGTPRLPRKDWKFQASCGRESFKGFEWNMKPKFHEPWMISRGALNFELHTSQSKNVGIFPEQENNWAWLETTIKRYDRPLKILNLFAYTGAATLVSAQAGAEVCHVDSAKSTVKWASENAEKSGLRGHKIRWIFDDAQKFIAKEIRRGNQYDGIILDPPPMGHGQGGRFEFRKDAFDLVADCKKLLVKEPAIFLLNAYAMNLTPPQLGQFIGPIVGLPLEVGELTIQESAGDRTLSCSVFARHRPGN